MSHLLDLQEQTGCWSQDIPEAPGGAWWGYQQSWHLACLEIGIRPSFKNKVYLFRRGYTEKSQTTKNPPKAPHPQNKKIKAVLFVPRTKRGELGAGGQDCGRPDCGDSCPSVTLAPSPAGSIEVGVRLSEQERNNLEFQSGQGDAGSPPTTWHSLNVHHQQHNKSKQDSN